MIFRAISRNLRPWLITLFLTLPSCGRGAFERSPAELIFAIGSNPTNLNPLYSTDAFSDKIGHLVYSSLFKRGRDGGLVPDLLEGWSLTGDTLYSFHLKSGVRFHDGRELTSEDILYTFEKIQDPKTGSLKRILFEKVKRMSAPSPDTFVIELREPYAPFLENLTTGIIPEGSMEGAGKGGPPPGSGPFVFKEYLKDQRVLLERNDGYYGKIPPLKRIVFRIVPDTTVRVLEILHGSVDILQNDIPPHFMEVFRREEGLKVIEGPGTLVKYLSFNLRKGPLKRLEVRQAIAHAINREEIARFKLKGMAGVTDTFMGPQTTWHNGELEGYPFSPERAEELLDRAGYRDPDGPGPEPRLTLTLKTSVDDVAVSIARIIKAFLKEVGIELKILSAEWGVFYHDIKSGDYELFTITAVGIFDPDYYRYLLHSSSIGRGANRSGYRNPIMDSLLDQGMRNLDCEKRKEIYDRVQELALSELPVLPLWIERNVAVMGRDVVGYYLTPNADFISLAGVEKRGD